MNGRVDTTAAFYYTVRNNITVQESVISFFQVGEQRSKGFDFDLNTDLGNQTSSDLQLRLRRAEVHRWRRAGRQDAAVRAQTQRQPVAAEGFRGGLNAAFGFRYLSEQFTDDANEQTLDSYGIAAAAVGYRTPRWDWTVNFDNLFNNEDYFTPGHFSNNAFPGQPFNVTTTIRLKWN